MANPAVPLSEVGAIQTKRFLDNNLGLAVKLGLIGILIWVIATMPEPAAFLR